MHNKIEPTRHQIAELLIDERISDLTQYLIEDYGYSVEQALDKVYQSHTMSILQEEESELYIQSSAYVYDMLKKELQLYPPFNNDSPNMAAERIQE